MALTDNIKVSEFNDLTVNTSHTLDLSQEAAYYPHNFISVTFKDTGGNKVLPTAGTVDIKMLPVNTMYWHDLDGCPFDANTGAFPSAEGNCEKIMVTTSSIVGATTVSIYISGNMG
jgi:hypothetical protein